MNCASLLVIRCAELGEDVARQIDRLRPVFGGDIVCVLDRMGKRAAPAAAAFCGAEVLPLTRATAEGLGMAVFPRAGWQCGDYALYAARAGFPGFDSYWMVEPDLVVNFDDPAAFFAPFAHGSADLAIPRFGPRGPEWRWSAPAAPLAGAMGPQGGVFCILRATGRALDHCRAARAAYLASDAVRRVLTRNFRGGPAVANDESFVCTTLAAAGFACTAMESVAPAGAFHRSGFSTGVPVLPEQLAEPRFRDRVLHPVGDGPSARHKFEKLARRRPEVFAAIRDHILATYGPARWASVAPGLAETGQAR